MDMKFDSGGLTHRTTSEDYIAESEEHLFELLKLPYIRASDILRMLYRLLTNSPLAPNYRNADI